MAKWYLEVELDYMTREDLFKIFNDLSCEGKNRRPEPVQGGSTWNVAVKGPKNMDAIAPLPDGVVKIHPR